MNPRPNITSYPVCIEEGGGNVGKSGFGYRITKYYQFWKFGDNFGDNNFILHLFLLMDICDSPCSPTGEKRTPADSPPYTHCQQCSLRSLQLELMVWSLHRPGWSQGAQLNVHYICQRFMITRSSNSAIVALGALKLCTVNFNSKVYLDPNTVKINNKWLTMKRL